MKLDPQTRVLIVGLGLMGGSYARALTAEGFRVTAVDTRREAIDFALANGFIEAGAAEPDAALLSAADLVVFALYPTVFVDWLKKWQRLFRPGALLTDVTGVKSCIVYEIQAMLRPDLEFIAAHPMAGRETCGVENSTAAIFAGANYIVVPTDRNSLSAIETCKALGHTLGFATVSQLPPAAHDEMIAFVSQLTHCIAVSLSRNSSLHISSLMRAMRVRSRNESPV